MIRVCAWHPMKFGIVKFMGVKAPLDDTRVAHGVCSECKLDLMLKTHIQAKQEAFDREWEEFNKIRLG